MRTIVMTICLLLASTLVQWAPTAEAQVNPDINLTCSPTAIEIDVAPGDTRIGTTYCDVANPTLYVEKVNIQITGAGLTYAAPGSIIVAAGDTTTFEVVFRGEDQMAEGSRQVTISARVDQANGVPCPTCTSQTTNVIVVVKQFAMLRIQANEPYVNVKSGETRNLTFNVYNEGNAFDIFDIKIANIDELRDAGFSFGINESKLHIPSKSYGQVTVQLTAPNIIIQEFFSTNNEDDEWDEDNYFQLDFQATSEHSIRSGGVEMSQTQMVTINVERVTNVGPDCEEGGDLPAPIMILGILTILSAALYSRRE